jgi:hypothetical protein
MDQPVNGGAQHQPLIARFSAFHPFGGRLSSFSALIVSTADRPSCDALPGGKSEPLSAYIPPARPPARLHVKRPHDPVLGARATRQRCRCLCPGRPLSPLLCDLTTAGTASQRTTMMHSQCPASAAQPPSRTPVGVV